MPARTMIYVRADGDEGLTRVLRVPHLTPEETRGTAEWTERIDGRLWEIRARYVHDLGGVPVFVETRRKPCPASSAEAPTATRVDPEPGSDRAKRQADETS